MTTEYFEFRLFLAKTLRGNLTYFLEKYLLLMSINAMYPFIVIQKLTKEKAIWF